MKAFHVYSLAPAATWYGREQSANRCAFPDFELLALILSALYWQRCNGSLKLYTDPQCADYFAARRLDGLWDEGIDTRALTTTRLDTNFTTFWAFARTIALYHERAPCVVLDMDMIVWKAIDRLLCSDFMAIHHEPLDFAVYKPRSALVTPPGYHWRDWDWTVSPCNAALMYFGDDAARQHCAEQGLAFMSNNFVAEVPDGPAYAVFVEQRLYPMCIDERGIPVGYFLRDFTGRLLADGAANDTFTHLWLHKRLLVADASQRQRLCMRMLRRILSEFPDFEDRVLRLPEIAAVVRDQRRRDSPQ